MLYVAENLVTGACEVFGEAGAATLCPRWRVGVVEPTRTLTLLDLEPEGAAMRIGALPALAQGDVSRPLSQQWARAIVEDQPAGPGISGVRYRSAYAGGGALALWDCPDTVRVIDTGTPQDLPLRHPNVLRRLRVGLEDLELPVTLISTADCRQCNPNNSS